jgi:hypothetical protein
VLNHKYWLQWTSKTQALEIPSKLQSEKKCVLYTYLSMYASMHGVCVCVCTWWGETEKERDYTAGKFQITFILM